VLQLPLDQRFERDSFAQSLICEKMCGDFSTQKIASHKREGHVGSVKVKVSPHAAFASTGVGQLFPVFF
jgi:hypothetical protein